MKKVLSVVGARPQFVKLAPMAESLRRQGAEHVIVHTGQHYDANMSDVFFADLEIPVPDVSLGIGSGSHGVQTGRMLAALDPVLEEHRPDWVLVYGDTNSTLAATLSAVKSHLPVAHLEAGLRSFNRMMPEEHNRVLTDHAADLLLAPTEVAMGHLASEGLAARSVLVGDVMTDICFRVRDAVGPDDAAVPAGLPDEFLVCTIHRAENTDDPARLAAVIDAVAGLPVAVLLLAHPRLVARCHEFSIALERPGAGLFIADPLPYPAMVATVLRSAGVVTDSGGLQKEAYLLSRPCTTIRSETEWVETLEGGWNVLAPQLDTLYATVTRPAPASAQGMPYGDGKAADRAASELLHGSPALDRP